MLRPVWIEVNLKALARNFRAIRKIIAPKTKIIATVKQEAYGHGLIPVARKLSSLGVDFFGVGSLEEAIALRENDFKEPILVLTACLEKHAAYFIEHNITPTVVNVSFAKKLNEAARKSKRTVPIHIKVDTGMGRIGPWHEGAEQLIKRISRCEYLQAEGVFTHFPSADTDAVFTRRQIKLFNELIDRCETKGIRFKYRHASNSAALVKYRQAHFNMVRPGIVLYGIKPHPSLNLNIESVLSLKSKVTFLKQVPSGRSISYGRTYFIRQPTTIATLAIGYADGYPWALSNRAKVSIKNRFFRVVGRVCMDHVMVDVGQARVHVGDTATLIGGKDKVCISTEEVARWAKTIPYEIVSRLSLKLPRHYRP